jgi:hypothetical protein
VVTSAALSSCPALTELGAPHSLVPRQLPLDARVGVQGFLHIPSKGVVVEIHYNGWT